MIQRLHTLDYLRGLAAFSIMAFHYVSWTLGERDASTLLGRFGIYGVSIFYVLSGLTLTYVYHRKFEPNAGFLRKFYEKRLFRIYPLLWLVTLLTIGVIAHQTSVRSLFLNLTGLFGLLDWSGGIATGVWSIGNELVFYLFFPISLWAFLRSKAAYYLLSLITLAVYVYFAFFVYDPASSFSDSNHIYFNPLNHLFLFQAGIMIAHFFQEKTIRPIVRVALLVVALGLFAFEQSSGDRLVLITGWERMLFGFTCILACIALFKWNLNLPNLIHKPLHLLGEWSYSLYLLHPLMYMYTGWMNEHYLHLPQTFRVAASIGLTFVASFLVYNYYEKFFVKLGAGKVKLPFLKAI